MNDYDDQDLPDHTPNYMISNGFLTIFEKIFS